LDISVIVLSAWDPTDNEKRALDASALAFFRSLLTIMTSWPQFGTLWGTPLRYRDSLNT